VRRTGSAVGPKNEGTAYILELNKKLSLSPGEETQKFREKKDKIRAHRAEEQATEECKKKRLFAKKNRSRRCAALEQKEGTTHDSGCGLDGICELVDDPSGESFSFELKYYN